jgi:hypothetical protein
MEALTTPVSKNALAREMSADEILEATKELYADVATSGGSGQKTAYLNTLIANYKQLTGGNLVEDVYHSILNDVYGELPAAEEYNNHSHTLQLNGAIS